ncbi:MAG: porin [Rhodomicrobiaceae bacterium]
MISRFALCAAAAISLGIVATKANAADLGSGCCADLEERVAELEATTARKGNRVVSLQVYGQVNKALLIWDNGEDEDAFIVDNDVSGSRFGLTGSAGINPGWTAGYKIELDVQNAASNLVSDGPDGADPDDEIKIRVNEVYIEGERWGRLTLGQGSTASDGSTEVVLGNSLSDSGVLVGTSIGIAGVGDTLGAFANNLDGKGRDNRIRYDSPSVYGFILSGSWGNDDFWDVALRFKKEWNSIRMAAAVAYLDDSTGDDDFQQISGSISVMHVPTGIYGAFAAAEQDIDNAINNPNFWYAQLGVEKRFLSYGSTTVYGEYGVYDDFEIDSQADRWGVGLVQKIDSAAMELYAQGLFYDVESGGDEGDLSQVLIGSRIKF